mgnify:CR=1 FL=1
MTDDTFRQISDEHQRDLVTTPHHDALAWLLGGGASLVTLDLNGRLVYLQEMALSQIATALFPFWKSLYRLVHEKIVKGIRGFLREIQGHFEGR